MTPFFDDIADIYDETRGLPNETMNHVVKVLVDQLQDHNPVLEIGVGTGRLAKPLQKEGIEVLGIDISEIMLKKALEKDLANLILGDCCALPFKGSSIDSIISVHVLHLLEDYNIALSEIAKVGKRNLISILYKKTGFSVREEFREAVSSCGYNLKMPGFGEQGLKDMVPPKSIVPIESFKDNFLIKERIKFLEDRKHSYTEKIPEEIHKSAIDYLLEKHENDLDSYPVSEIEVVVWDIADLKGFTAL
ncbi:MAG: class I SAM-dependent methyltransferase [Thermoplasmata archaeon]|nr:MAG: class I SAM-dependent methyltransferase [Thermoplasmata archaeon]